MWHFLDVHAGAIQAICAALALLIGVIGAVLLLHTLKANAAQARVASDQFAVAQKQYSESLRPIIVVSVEDSNEHTLILKLTNDGTGAALNMDGMYTQTVNLLGAKSSCTVAAPFENPEKHLLVIRYESLDGRCFETSVAIYSRANCLTSYREITQV